MPNGLGLRFDDARSAFEAIGLRLSVPEGDPDAADATVVAQHPEPVSTAIPGSAVVARTALVNDGVCAALDTLPRRPDDIRDFARTQGLADALRAAAPSAAEPLRTDIAAVLAFLESGTDPDDPAALVSLLAVDRIAIHREACAMT